MKRYVRANKYQDAADSNLQKIKRLADALVKISDANNEVELAIATQDLGSWSQGRDKGKTLEGVIDMLEYFIGQYKEDLEKVDRLPYVKEELLNFCREQGYDPVEISLPTGMARQFVQGDEVYRLSEDAEFGEHHKLCQAIKDMFNVKFDSGLGGSWTAHSGSFEGVPFTVGFQRDYELDPTGKTSSLQIYF